MLPEKFLGAGWWGDPDESGGPSLMIQIEITRSGNREKPVRGKVGRNSQQYTFRAND
jgi:hypothetical protein